MVLSGVRNAIILFKRSLNLSVTPVENQIQSQLGSVIFALGILLVFRLGPAPGIRDLY
jgi:hypothetical protein